MPDYAPLLTALDARRAEFLDALDSVPDRLKTISPGGAKWSPVQILDHLLRVERGFAHVMGRQIEKGEARRDVGTPSERSVEGLIRAMRTPAQFKIPDGVPSLAPDSTQNEAALRTDWRAAGERWHDLARSFPDDLVETGLVHHAVGGAMTFGQTLRFLEAHIEHHLHQLARTVRALAA